MIYDDLYELVSVPTKIDLRDNMIYRIFSILKSTLFMTYDDLYDDLPIILL